jgi:hypothetical protein
LNITVSTWLTTAICRPIPSTFSHQSSNGLSKIILCRAEAQPRRVDFTTELEIL